MIHFVEALLKNRHFLKYGGNTVWLLTERVTQMGLAFLVGIFIARSLGPAAFGLLNFAISYGLLFSAFVLLGMDQILVKELVKRPDEAGVILGSGIALRLVGFGVMAAVVAGSSLLLDLDARTRIMILLVLLGYVGVVMNGIDAFFQARVCARYTAMATISGSVIFAILNLLGCFYQFDLYFFALTNGMIVLFSAGVKWWIYNHSFSGIRSWRCSGREMKNILRQSNWLFWQLAMNAVAANVGYLILKLVCDNQVIGYYAVVIKVTACFIAISEVICLSLFPAVLHVFDRPELYRRRLNFLYFGNFWGSMAIVGAACLAGKFLVVLLYGDSYVQPGALLWVGLLCLPLSAIAQVFSRWCVIEGSQRALFIFSIGQAFGAVGITWLLARQSGLTGAVLSYPLVYASGWLFCLFCGKRIRTELKNICRALLSFGLLKTAVLHGVQEK
jgi:PST family polysaccharide transporter